MTDATTDTRTRLMEAALQLFAERGFKSTTIADIETAAGLVPRAGTFYHHFASKRALLEAAVEYRSASLGAVAERVLGLLPLGDLRAELLVMGRAVFKTIDENLQLILIIEKEPDLHRQFHERFRDQTLDLSLRFGVEMLRNRLGDRAATFDLEAVIAVFGSALLNFRRAQWTTGRSPMDIDEQRFLETWADAATTYLQRGP